MQRDLMALEVEGRFELILVHGTLHYIPPDRRVDVLVRLRQALRPAGVLVLLFNTGCRVVGELSSEGRSHYAKWVIEELQRAGVPLPEEREAFAGRLCVHAEIRELREGAFGRPEEVIELLAGSGFDVRQWFEVDVKLADPVQGFVSKLSKRRFIAIAENFEVDLARTNVRNARHHTPPSMLLAANQTICNCAVWRGAPLAFRTQCHLPCRNNSIAFGGITDIPLAPANERLWLSRNEVGSLPNSTAIFLVLFLNKGAKICPAQTDCK